jgi:hypothetical protein
MLISHMKIHLEKDINDTFLRRAKGAMRIEATAIL